MSYLKNSTKSRSLAQWAFGASAHALGISLMIVAGQGVAHAQTADKADEKAAIAAQDDGEIIVTGFRRSVESSTAVKRDTNFFADIVSADDIAGLPDVSIAESLARLPGVSAQRTGGQASAINIRGLSQDLVSATLNGREQVATSGNRTIEFDQYPSELITQAAVYKTPVASILEGGIAGKVELKTVRPLSSKKDFSATINVRGLFNDRANQSPDVSQYGYRVSLSGQAKFSDKVGVALGYSRLYQPNVATRFVQFDFPTPGNNGSPRIDLNGDGRVDSLNFGFEAIQFGGRETRDAGIGVIQIEPNDKLHVLIDGYYSQFNSDVKRRGFRATATQSGDNIFTNPIVADSALVGGRITNNIGSNGFGFALGTELVNQDESRRDTLYTIGGNVGYDLTDTVKFAVDLSYSRGTSFFNNAGINLRPYDLVAGAGGATTPVRQDSIPGRIFIDYALNGTNLPTVNALSNDFTNTARSNGGFLLDGQFLVPQRDTDALFATAGDLTIETPGSKLFKDFKFGFRYSDRQAVRTITSFNTFGIPGGPLALPANLVSIAGFRGNYAAAGLPNFAVVDINGAFNLAFGNNLGVNQPTDQNAFGFTIDQSFTVDETTYTGYGQVDFDTLVGNLPLRGNVGLRAVNTDQSSTVFVVDPNSSTGDRIFVTRGKNFTDFLPSANFILSVSNSDLVRFSYSRQISRPRFFELRGSISVNTGSDGNTSGSGGNPQLDPFRANQFDLGFEHYFARNSGLFAAAVFFKDLQSFIINGSIGQFDFVAAGLTPPPIPGTSTPGNAVGSFSAPVNGQGGYVWGVELSFTKNLTELPGLLSGLGVQLNYAYSESDLSFPSSTSGATINLPLPGLSRHVLNPIIFYERSGFGARVSTRYRSSFVSPQIGISELVLTSAPETVVDAQLSYEFPKTSRLNGVKLLAQVNNLTDAPTRTYFGQVAQTGTIQNFGRTIFLGATLTF